MPDSLTEIATLVLSFVVEHMLCSKFHLLISKSRRLIHTKPFFPLVYNLRLFQVQLLQSVVSQELVLLTLVHQQSLHVPMVEFLGLVLLFKELP